MTSRKKNTEYISCCPWSDHEVCIILAFLPHTISLFPYFWLCTSNCRYLELVSISLESSSYWESTVYGLYKKGVPPGGLANCSYFLLACARIALRYYSWNVLNEQSENKTRATWERGAPAGFLHFLLLNDFSLLSRSLEQDNLFFKKSVILTFLVLDYLEISSPLK